MKLPAQIFGVAALLAAWATDSFARDYFAYFGTYTGKGSQGIYRSRFDATTGQLSTPELAAEISNPNFLTLTPDHKFLLAAADNLGATSPSNSGVASFAINPTNGALTLVNSQSCGWRGVCHVNVDNSGHYALAASYNSGAIATLSVSADGHLGPKSSEMVHHGSSVNTNRQASAHAHQIVTDAANQFAFVCDLGMDKLMSYRLDAAHGTLTPNDPAFTAVAPGTGPRHLVFHPHGKFAYVINELASTVSAFSYDAQHGTLKEIQSSSSLPAGFTNVNTAAELALHPSGRFLYASNRGHDSVAVFASDETNGQLTFLEHQSTHGKTPRYLSLDPTGKFLFALNQNSANASVFEVNAVTGKLKLTEPEFKLNSPVCVQFVEKD
jgi:6-phosphogluconolactonase